MARETRSIEEILVNDVEKRKHPGKHYVYVVTVTWSDGDVNILYRRYSKFFDFQVRLLDAFPKDAGKNNPGDRIIPFLPGKIIFGRSHIKEVALKRLEPINQYCKQLIQLPPLISDCQHVRDFFTTTLEDLTPNNNNEGSSHKTPATAESISEPILLEQYVVIADYEKEGVNEIDLIAGELIDVIEKNDNGWWFVSGCEGQGWIPSSYLELPDGKTEAVATAQGDTDHPYLATTHYSPRESDELCLEVGSVVEVMEKSLDGWWLVRCKGKVGRVPGTYLARTDTLRAKRIKEVIPKGGVTIVQNLSSVSNLLNKPNHNKSSDVGGSSDPSNARHVLPASVSSSHDPTPTSPTPARRHYQKAPPLPAGKRPKIVDLVKPNGIPMAEDSPLANRKPPPPRRGTIKKMASPRRPDPPEEPVYMTITDFNNQAGDGISFKKGLKVEMLDKRDGGWWYVRINGEDGWAPSSYIEKTLPSSSIKQKLFTTDNHANTSDEDSERLPAANKQPRTGAKPLPAIPLYTEPKKKTRLNNDWTSHDDEEDVDGYSDMNRPDFAYNSSDTVDPPPLPPKGPSTSSQRNQAPIGQNPRVPITSPRNQRRKPDFNQNKPIVAETKPAVPPSKPNVAKHKPSVPPVMIQNKPPPQHRPEGFTPNNLMSELISRQAGNLNRNKVGENVTSGTGSRPKLPAQRITTNPQDNVASASATCTSGTNVKSIKNMFEGR